MHIIRLAIPAETLFPRGGAGPAAAAPHQNPPIPFYKGGHFLPLPL